MGQFNSMCMNCFSYENVDGKCTKCGYDESAERFENALSLRTLLNDRYLIGNVKSVNKAVIKYYAYDNHSESKVCVVEYFPYEISLRKGNYVSAKEGCEHAFNPNKFAETAVSLKRFNSLPSMIPILNSFAENGTYYVVIADFEHVTLRDKVSNNGPYKWDEFNKLIYPVLATVSGLNSNGILHLGLSADSIIVCNDGKLRIDDTYLNMFRVSNSDGVPFLSNDGFTSLEQYKEEELGGYSDVYSLSSVIFYALSGTQPRKATSRVSNSTLTISGKTAQNITKNIIEVLSKGLNVFAADRHTSVESFIINLNQKSKTKEPVVVKEVAPKQPMDSKKLVLVVAAGLCTTFLLVIIVLVVLLAKSGSNNQGGNIPYQSFTDVSSTQSYIANGHAVADYIGKSYSEVFRSSGNNMYFNTEIKVEHRDDVSRGLVVKQEPAAGTILEEGSTIELTISLGPMNAVISDYKGWTLSKTVIDLLSKGYSYSNIKCEYKTDIGVEYGKVIGTSIPVNEKGNVYDEITIYISNFKYSALTSSVNSDVSSIVQSGDTSSQ